MKKLHPREESFYSYRKTSSKDYKYFSTPQVAAKFMVEDDEEQMKEELKEAFRIYDKEVGWFIRGRGQKLTEQMFQSSFFSAKDSSQMMC